MTRLDIMLSAVSPDPATSSRDDFIRSIQTNIDPKFWKMTEHDAIKLLYNNWESVIDDETPRVRMTTTPIFYAEEAVSVPKPERISQEGRR